MCSGGEVVLAPGGGPRGGLGAPDGLWESRVSPAIPVVVQWELWWIGFWIE
jgi:hypothetical protein